MGIDFYKEQMDFLDSLIRKDVTLLSKNVETVVDLNYYDSLLPQAIVVAISNDCSVEIIKKLIELGSNINIQCEITGMLPIHFAAKLGRTDCVNLLIENGSQINVQDNIGRKTPLHYAIEENHVDTVKCLLEHKANVSISDLDGYSPIHMAVESQSFEIVDMLYRKGADINAISKYDEQTALHIACIQDNADIAIRIIRLGAKANLEDIYGMTPNKIVIKNGNFILSKVLERTCEEQENYIKTKRQKAM